jgi:hypothetical protein
MDVARLEGEPCKETCMETRAGGRVRYVVERSIAGRWDVNQDGFDEPIASFEERADALEYALRLADRKTDAQVRVRH